MKRFVYLFLLLLIANNSYGQYFEGRVKYKLSSRSFLPIIPDKFVADLVGKFKESFISGNNSKSFYEGGKYEWEMYLQADKKTYYKLAGSKAITWMPQKYEVKEDDEIVKSQLNRNVGTILGFMCDELILTRKSHTETFYFNANLATDPVAQQTPFYMDIRKHMQTNKSLPVPLMFLFEYTEFAVEGIAVEVEAMEVDSTMFKLPPGARLTKNPMLK